MYTLEGTQKIFEGTQGNLVLILKSGNRMGKGDFFFALYPLVYAHSFIPNYKLQ